MDKIPYLKVSGFCTKEELAEIWDEIDFLSNPFLLLSPELTGSGTLNGVPLKKNKGVFIRNVYKTDAVSPMWRVTRKIFNGLTRDFANLHISNRPVLNTDYSTLLLSYYDNLDKYPPHQDSAVTTVLFWFYREPRAFSGGDLIFNDTGEVVQLENNCMVMFPSWALHSVTPVKMIKNCQGEKLGRYCFTLFLYQSLPLE